MLTRPTNKLDIQPPTPRSPHHRPRRLPPGRAADLPSHARQSAPALPTEPDPRPGLDLAIRHADEPCGTVGHLSVGGGADHPGVGDGELCEYCRSDYGEVCDGGDSM